ncbi:hypothetical protein CcaverHIS002_0106340 [Cutaneotrichosporon cavernicola]|uniref:Glutathione synthetase n=1 Tax=Cutaneotrichosporon cavernicola TaxID=279322 RepID=A0AA48I4V4_9TREE|nr:uncharacterized protein CcaverHIS019_0106280 [Cutaneotrichosporon cavernicola]BEI80105.1 hypothetical protein CcaverHIS002_0106340 [Cutaneotrichosporon cavernicola]BEI87910.1 hypothetical protein CcaverHIS019_0106280 [Cutaneotrichosporon cavernicola]BEI95684.1 hypothetical protein CcaverHIS631_0106330 [Cutaneotrichosporon cavernicola]BEJ03458.1 hypothetical protein CcaverHIS641_0106330 [Cutaneotrichosporon cavernicola]
MSPLPAWPPALSEAQQADLAHQAATYALANGFTLLPVPPKGEHVPAIPTQVIAAPLSLLPTPFPRPAYVQAKSIQRLYNALYARVALDWEFLDGIMQYVAPVDDFQAELWNRWKAIRDEIKVTQPVQLGIFRSDYLLHEQGNAVGEKSRIKQVEFNTIAASFGALSQKASEMHRYLSEQTNYYHVNPQLHNPNSFVDNHSLEDIAAGLAEGFNAYGNSDAVVLFVVQEGERNVFDQRALEYQLLKRHRVKSVRLTFAQVAQRGQLDDDKVFWLDCPLRGEQLEVALVYYRAAYTPADYMSSAEWDTRVLLERSTAIKCPSMALQLAGAKKVQQVLAEPGVLEDMLLGNARPDVGFGAGPGSLGARDAAALRETWTGLWPLDSSEEGTKAVQLANEHPERFVLKPQREGGGNNIYRGDIPPYLAKLEEEDKSRPGEAPRREAYILMELIEPPKGVHNLLVRGGEGTPRLADVVSELGVYGVALYGGKVTPVNREAGTLLRTKGRESDEGGVAIGISSIDSPLLV